MNELKDTVDLMLSADWRDRFKAEFYQLQIRIKDLTNYIESLRDTEPLDVNIGHLTGQLFYMENYSLYMVKRAEEYDIQLW